MTCKAHGGPIEIFGITIAQVDDQTRLQAVDTWMDPLDMFRQIAPHGIVNSEPMSHKVALADALDALPDNDGIKIAKAHEGASGVHGEDLSPESVMGKHVSNSTGQAADAFVPGQGACPFMGGSQTNGNAGQAPHPLPIRALNGNAMNVDASPTGIESTDATVVDTDRPAPQLVAPMPDTETKDSRLEEATDQGAAMEVDPQFSSPDTQMANDGETLTSKRPAEDVPRSIYSSSVTGNVEESIKAAKRDVFVDEPTATGTRDAIDEKLESSADQVHSHPKDIEQAVRPQAGEAVIAPADSRETQETMKEMSEIRPEECPAVMNRE